MTVWPPHTGALRAQARDLPIAFRMNDGSLVEEELIVERRHQQEKRSDCTVAVVLATGELIHLGDVKAVRLGAATTTSAGAAGTTPRRAR